MNQAVRPSSPLDRLFAEAGGVHHDPAATLRAAREHLRMDVAFISEFHDDGSRVIRYVDNRDPHRAPLPEGAVLPRGDGYCQQVVDGRLPGLIPDTAREPAARTLAATRQVPIGACLAVPIRLLDGHVYGTLSCLGFEPDHSLNERDLALLRALAGRIGRQISRDLVLRQQRDSVVERITGALVCNQPDLVYQPIFQLQEPWHVCGVEVLSRFRPEPVRGPQAWFAEAHSIGLGPALELHAIRRALQELRDVPGDFDVAVNCSPDTVLHPDLARALAPLPAERLVLEITEHARVDDYDALLRTLGKLRADGVRLAIDDAGAGYASMKHILALHPDIIKLDIGITRNIDRDWGRHSLGAALVRFADGIGATIVAEGVETASELEALRKLGVHKGQGFFMNKPMSLHDLAEVLDEEKARDRV